MIIYTKGCFTILGKIDSDPEIKMYQFEMPNKEAAIKVTIDLNLKQIEIYSQFEASEQILAVLNQNEEKPINDIKSEEKLSQISVELIESAKKVLSTIKYGLEQEGIDESLISVKEEYWSSDKNNWKLLPRKLRGTLEALIGLRLDKDTEKIVQSYLVNNFEPFFALRHLHRAKREQTPRYKWLEATIAAELAIKEFLIRIRPELETLLLEVPSPPLPKLYGSVLESFTGQRSPVLNELKKGAEIRNKLIHRPNEEVITYEAANKYVHVVELAIYHLLALLYPDDKNIQVLKERVEQAYLSAPNELRIIKGQNHTFQLRVFSS